jgi:hypothetical protein
MYMVLTFGMDSYTLAIFYKYIPSLVGLGQWDAIYDYAEILGILY